MTQGILMAEKTTAASGTIEFTTMAAASPSDAGTGYPATLSVICPTGNFAQSIQGQLEPGITFKHSLDTSPVGAVRSVGLRLNGLAPTAS